MTVTIRGYMRERAHDALIHLAPPPRRSAFRFNGRLHPGQHSQHRLPHARKLRTLLRLQRFVADHHWQRHPCGIGPGEFDHDFRVVSESYGDPGVINGTATDFWRECRTCGATAEATYADLQDDFDDWNTP